MVNAITFDETNIAPLEDPKTSAKSDLKEERKNATFGVEGGTSVYRNSRGRGVLEDLRAMRRELDMCDSRLAKLTEQFQNHERKSEEHREELIALKGRVAQLVQLSEGQDVPLAPSVAGIPGAKP